MTKRINDGKTPQQRYEAKRQSSVKQITLRLTKERWAKLSKAVTNMGGKATPMDVIGPMIDGMSITPP